MDKLKTLEGSLVELGQATSGRVVVCTDSTLPSQL
jgi:hypothetical protein